jgi:5,10-methylenetetrahydromethanopterin reductase
MEFWTASVNVPGQAANKARQASEDGFDGISMGDTASLAADPYVGLTVAAAAAPNLKLLVGVTNPVTRHPALTACAIASVQIESGGRAALGIGRGDSAVSKFGLRAASVSEFELYLTRLQGYLRGDIVDMDGKSSSLEWLQAMGAPKVPVDVAATGPGVIAVGARQAERITFNLGANAERIAAGIEHARQVRKDAGLPVDGLSFGAYLPVAPHPDIRAARQLVKGVTGVYARFQAMPGHPRDELRSEDAKVIQAVGANYDNSRHGRADAGHAALLEDDFVDRFAAIGPADQVVEKLAALFRLGLDRLIIVGPNRIAAPEDYAESQRLLSEVVLPEVRRTA